MSDRLFSGSGGGRSLSPMRIIRRMYTVIGAAMVATVVAVTGRPFSGGSGCIVRFVRTMRSTWDLLNVSVFLNFQENVPHEVAYQPMQYHVRNQEGVSQVSRVLYKCCSRQIQASLGDH
jgi:hypothetical protein